MLKRVFPLLLFLLLVSCTAQAQVLYYITTQTIYINIDEEGNAGINEKFFLSFPNETEVEIFRSESEGIGVDLEGWREFNPRFRTSIGNSEDIIVSDIGFVENESKYLEIQYTLKEPMMQKNNETTRRTEFSLNPKFFNDFVEGSLWVIPNSSTIIIDLPLQAEILEPVKPEANIQGNRIVWTGYKSSNVLSLKYVTWKQIASITLNEVVSGIASSDTFPVVLLAAALLLAAIFIKRKAIAGRIEEYIVEHSDFTAMEEDE